VERVQDYFLWRQEDAHRNSLNAHCYWLLRKEGRTIQEATKELEGRSVSFKNELLFSRGMNFDQLPSWQKRGIGIWKEQYEKEGYNPVTASRETAVRNRLKVAYELPLGEAYAKMVSGFISYNPSC
ncbi:MAG: guanylyltransferase, partial [Lachnospiraceae bacterium]|nr:guanylyltransferase [Lachnospiraceae bacterium]